MIYRTYYLSPLGRILLAADDIGLIGVWFEGQIISSVNHNISPSTEK